MRCLSSPSGRRGVKIGGVDHRRGSSARRRVQTAAAAGGCDLHTGGGAGGVIHGKAAHGKRPTENRQQKRGRRGAGRVYLFFRVKFSGGWNHPPPVLLSSGGWNPSRAIFSAHACMMYLCKLCPLSAAAARTFAPSSFVGRSVMLSCRRLYAMFAFFCAALVGIVTPPFDLSISYPAANVNVYTFYSFLRLRLCIHPNYTLTY